MDRNFAIEILIALACCSVTNLHCIDNCPLYDVDRHACRPWTDDEVREAVYALKGERKDNG